MAVRCLSQYCSPVMLYIRELTDTTGHFYGDEHDNPHGSDIVIKEMSTPASK